MRKLRAIETSRNPQSSSRDLALIILAAGRGSRLHMEAAKWLLEIQGRPIAEWQFDALEQIPGPQFNRRLLVAGYQCDEIRQYLSSTAWQLEILENTSWRQRNNWYSMLLALRYMDDEGFNGDVMFLNADLVASTSHFAELINWMPKSDSLLGILVDFAADLDDEAMKVELNADGRVSHVGKLGLTNPCAECIGASRLTPSGRQRIREIFEGFIGDARRQNSWYDEAYDILIQESLNAADAVSLISSPSGVNWVEIDDQQDLARAQEMLL